MSKDDQLRAQIEATLAEHYSTTAIDQRIAAQLMNGGKFDGLLDSQELELVLRNIVYISFGQQRFAGKPQRASAIRLKASRALRTCRPETFGRFAPASGYLHWPGRV